MGHARSSSAGSRGSLRRTTLVVSATLALVAVLGTPGCHSLQQNGQECLKNDDCESKRCIQYVCVDPASGKATDTGVAPSDTGGAEAATDAPAADAADAADAPAEAEADTAKADSGGD